MKTKGQITKHFSVDEVANPSAKEEYDLVISPEMIAHLQRLETFRVWFGGAMIVTSGYRTKAFNEKVGGIPNSLHLTGEATDIKMKTSTSVWNLYAGKWQEICKNAGVGGEIIRHNTYIHFGSSAKRKGFIRRDETT